MVENVVRAKKLLSLECPALALIRLHTLGYPGQEFEKIQFEPIKPLLIFLKAADVFIS